MKHCSSCSSEFDVSDDDRGFYKKIGVPEPTLCPSCRQQRRLVQANHLFLYKRKCDFTGKEIIAQFPLHAPFPVYDQSVWYSDAWDPLKYGQDYDFSRPFFEQFAELRGKIPRPNLFTAYQYDENSAYTNHSGKNKNCYFIFDSDENWDSLYSYSINGCRSSMDLFRVRNSELCYECVDCLTCYNSAYLENSENCSDSYFLKNCIGCVKCIFSVNLRNKKFYIRNQPVSETEYQTFVEQLRKYGEIQKTKEEFSRYEKEFPRKYMHGTHNEDVLGDYLVHSKNSQYCFDCSYLWDCKYVCQAWNPIKTSMDIQECGDGDHLYECTICGYNSVNMLFCAACLDECSDIQYSMYCFHSSNLFGCMGLRHKKYCILNKQYSQEEYEALIPKIIEHMKSKWEYGEFFPSSFSMFGYNETLAQEYFPLTKDEALKKGYRWKEEEKIDMSGVVKQIPASRLPESILNIPDDILNWAIECESSGRLFRIQKSELKLCRQMNMPIPHHHFLVRHEARRKMRNPQKLWKRNCGQCGIDIQTSYAPERPEKIFCEACYLQTIQ